jgi:dinuclear metal center YbgI/SA1388 family protein
MTSSDFLKFLHRLAPLELSAEWDNTGLLLEGHQTELSGVLLTLDLTAPVAKEAIRKKVGMVISYHPPIFSGLKSLTREDPLAAPLLDLLQHGISVYSPHTALDAAIDGISDWLCQPFEDAEVEIIDGSGRILRFPKALAFSDICDRFQQHLNLPYLRVSIPLGRTRKIKTLALCPGAGSSLLSGLDVGAVFTDEMKHHDVLSFHRRGIHVLISEHGHTERPYLTVLKKRLAREVPKGFPIYVSRKDVEPLTLLTPHA